MRTIAAVGLVVLLSSCRSGGDLIANPHTISEEAAFVASAMPTVAPVPRELQKATLPNVYVQPGDVLLLEPTNLADPPRMPADQTILPDGTIDLGIYGRPNVAGMTLEQIEAVVREAVYTLEPHLFDVPEDLDAEEARELRARIVKGPINVRLIGNDSKVYYVLGEVTAPGSYPLEGHETVLDAVLAAGGLSDRADRCEIIVSRPTPPLECRVVMRVCYNRLVQLGDTTTNYQILPGDRIYVASKTFCGSLAFWKKGCEHCCDTGSCPCPCPTTVAHLNPPFAVANPLATSGWIAPPMPEEADEKPEDVKDGEGSDLTPLPVLDNLGDEPPEADPVEPKKPEVDLPAPPKEPAVELPKIELLRYERFGGRPMKSGPANPFE